MREVFGECGIPFAIEPTERLGRAPVLSALANILRLEAAGWPYRQLLAILGHNYFRPAWREWQDELARLATYWAIRQLQVPRGRHELIDAVQRRATARPKDNDQDSLGNEDAERQERNRERFQLAGGAGEIGKGALEGINRARTLAQWIAALQDLAGEFGLLDKSPAGGSADHDRKAWDSSITALAAAEQLEAWLGSDSRKTSLLDLIQLIEDILASEPFPADCDEVGRVRVLSAQAIRGLEVPYLFVAGLAEKSFPLPARRSPL